MGRKRSAELTARQREWLAHLRKARSAGESLRGYAQRHGLSEHALYQAAKDLRRRGAWPESSRVRPGVRHSFVRVSVAAPAAEAVASWRIRLPNGVWLEGAGALDAGLLEALAGLRA